ncbi:MAG: FIST C-terminal domain-containing protein [Myxococcales bacterium]|nr:FIST C-terminal domain-containing protein [Myxococcales bacterium]
MNAPSTAPNVLPADKPSAAKWAAGVSDAEALDVAIERARAALGSLADKPDVLMVFVSPHHEARYGELAELLAQSIEPAALVGCSGNAVIGAGTELEGRPGLALLAGRIPGCTVRAHWLSPDVPPPEDERWLEIAGDDPRGFILLADPFTLDADAVGRALDQRRQGATVGGLASGALRRGETAIFLDGRLERTGGALLSLSGDVTLDAVVAQGCRPVGRPRFVTRARGNVIDQIDGRSAASVLRELYEQLDERDSKLFRNSLFIGIAMREQAETYQIGDFLVRSLIGVDTRSGALAIGAPVEDYTVIQFHLRDAQTSTEELEQLLARYVDEHTGQTQPESALVFSCLGRGVGLYGEPDHDSRRITNALGRLPTAGFFCNGEIGPVAGRPYLHGYTSVVALFRPRG